MDHDLSLSKLRPAEPRGSIYADEYLTEESGDEGDSPRLVAKKIKKLGYRKKKYKVITNKMREELIDAIENNNEKIKDAAKRLRMNYSSAKSILQVYKKEGRLNKKGFRRKSGVKNEFSEDYDEEEGEFVEKVEFIKEESSATISRKEIVPIEESEDEVQPPQKPIERSKVAQLTPKQATPEKQVSPKAQALQETINPISLFQQQQSQFNYSLNNTNLTHLNFFPSAAASSMKTNFANNSYFPPNSFSSLPFAGTNFQGAFPSKDNFAFKTSNLVGGLQQKPAQRNFNSLTGTNLYQENPVFMQNLIQTNFYPSQYIAAAAGNRYWNPLMVGGNQLVRPASNQLVGNFGVNTEVQLPKVEDFDI